MHTQALERQTLDEALLQRKFPLLLATIALCILLASEGCETFGEDRLGEDGTEGSFSPAQMEAINVEYYQV